MNGQAVGEPVRSELGQSADGPFARLLVLGACKGRMGVVGGFMRTYSASCARKSEWCGACDGFAFVRRAWCDRGADREIHAAHRIAPRKCSDLRGCTVWLSVFGRG